MSNQQFASAVRNATFVGSDNPKVPGNRGCIAILDVTVAPGVDTVQLIIEGKDLLSGKYYQILAAAARVGAGTDVLRAYEGATIAANLVANDSLPDVYRIRVVHVGVGNFTYSVSVRELG